MDVIARLFTLAAWGGVVVLLLLLYRIAYFYQVTSKQPTHYRIFLIPIALLALGGLRYAAIGIRVGDLIGDSLQLAGGVALILLGMFLLREMTGGRR